MNFVGTLNAGIASLAQGMKNGAENCKVEGKIAEQQRRIKVLKKEIGNLTIVKLDGGEEMCPEIMERYAAIQEARALIEELKKGKEDTVAICPICGAKNDVDMNYCGKCGAMMMEEEREDE